MCVLIHHTEDDDPEDHDGKEGEQHHKDEEHQGGDCDGETEKLLRRLEEIFLSSCQRVQLNLDTIQYNTVCTIQYNTICTIQFNTIQYNTIQYNMYNTIQYNMYNTIKFNTMVEQSVVEIKIELYLWSFCKPALARGQYALITISFNNTI